MSFPGGRRGIVRYGDRMPATFPSHPAAVLPVKVCWPRRFDGVALVIGSMAPDQMYPLTGVVDLLVTHTYAGLVWFCLPVTLLLCWPVRRVAPFVAAHLPARGPLGLGDRFAWRDYGVLGTVRHPWYVTAWSALLGAASHLALDAFTHPGGAGTVHAPIPLLHTVVGGRPLWWLLQQLFTVLGALLTVLMLGYIGRHRLLRRWHGDPPPVPYRPALFWGVFGAVALLYAVTLPLLPYAFHAFVQGVRVLWAFGLALLAASVAVALRPAVPVSHEPG